MKRQLCRFTTEIKTFVFIFTTFPMADDIEISGDFICHAGAQPNTMFSAGHWFF